MAKHRAHPYVTPWWLIAVMAAWDVGLIVWVAVWPALPWLRWTLTPFGVGGLILMGGTWTKRRETLREWQRHLEFEAQMRALGRRS